MALLPADPVHATCSDGCTTQYGRPATLALGKVGVVAGADGAEGSPWPVALEADTRTTALTPSPSPVIVHCVAAGSGGTVDVQPPSTVLVPIAYAVAA